MGSRIEAIEESTGGRRGSGGRIQRVLDLIELAETDCNENARDAEASVIVDDVLRKRVEPVSDCRVAARSSYRMPRLGDQVDRIGIGPRTEQVRNRFRLKPLIEHPGGCPAVQIGFQLWLNNTQLVP